MASQTVPSEVIVLTRTRSSHRGAIQSKGACTENRPNDVFKSLHTNLGIRLKPCPGRLTSCSTHHFTPQAHEVCQFHVGGFRDIPKQDKEQSSSYFLLPFNLSSCPTPSQGWRLEGRRQRWGGRNTENPKPLTVPSRLTSPVPQKPAMNDSHGVHLNLCVRDGGQPGHK